MKKGKRVWWVMESSRYGRYRVDSVDEETQSSHNLAVGSLWSKLKGQRRREALRERMDMGETWPGEWAIFGALFLGGEWAEGSSTEGMGSRGRVCARVLF